PVAAIASVPQLTCDTTEITLNAAGSSNGVNFTYQWAASNGGHIMDGINTLSPQIDEPGTYTLTVTDQTNGCTRTASVVVGEDVAPPSADAGPDTVLTCKTPELPLGGAGMPSGPRYKIEWGGPVFEVNGKVWTNQPGTYTVTVTDLVNGCKSADEVVVTQDITAPFAYTGTDTMLTCKLP
ncbi:MAG: hypothetical protein ACKOCH_22550, partial [Bacteroidota bacterium]